MSQRRNNHLSKNPGRTTPVNKLRSSLESTLITHSEENQLGGKGQLSLEAMILSRHTFQFIKLCARNSVWVLNS